MTTGNLALINDPSIFMQSAAARTALPPGWTHPRKCQFVAERQPMRIEVITSAKDLVPHRVAWEDLCLHAVESNVFYEPWMLLSAAESFGAASDLCFVLVYTTGPSNEGSKQILCGFFPLALEEKFKGLPVRHCKFWKYKYCVLTTPLVRAEYARDCLQAFYDWIGESKDSGAFLSMEYISGDGLFNQLLTDIFNDSTNLYLLEERYNRALLMRAADGEGYINQALSGKRRKELRRQEKLLRECGNVSYTSLSAYDDVSVWLEQFLQLEAEGWKGEEGSALNSQPATRNFFLRAMKEGAERGQLMMLALHLDGKPIALKCNLLAGEGAYAFKIAFDEHYAQFSPGMHLELENIRRLHADPRLQWMDSCATARHFMINRLWMERRNLKTVLIASGKGHGNAIIAMLPIFRWLKRKFKPKHETTE